ncbi:MAG TPA: Na+/H+ antiporter NhaA, partial [Thermoleophilaceae bacterium]|nr:Na+/H+ antiporter NhaA [Thermoleophilaceae bacterium]
MSESPHTPQPVTPWEETTSRSVREFLRTESGSAGLLLAATLVALVWANSPLSGSYEDLWGTHLRIQLGGAVIDEDLGHWVNDALMAVFFYLVGLEIRRELSLGELRDRRAAAIPVIAALAGMAVPALLYVAVNAGGDGARGWGIVMATDIAFVLGVVALLGSRCPPGVRLFLLTLAIVDDIGAVAVIAAFYSSGIDLVALGGAAAVLGLVVVGRRLTTWRGPAYVVAGIVLWLLTYASGVHPTIAAVALGLVTAVHPPRRETIARAASLGRVFRRDLSAEGGRAAALEVSSAVSPNERFQQAIHPWSSYLVVPLFALANAGVSLSGDALSRAVSSPITLGVILGLVVGKGLGVSLVAGGAVRAGLGRLPEGLRDSHLVSASALAGIGFTVSLFVTDLAFESEALRDEAKVGVLAASALAAALGWALFRTIDARAPASTREAHLDPPAARTDHVRGPADAP